MNTKHIEALVNEAIKKGRIPEQDRQKWMKTAKTHFVEVRAALAAEGDPNKALADVITDNAQLLKF